MIENPETGSFADDNTIQTFDDSKATIIRLLKGDINNALEWFEYNQMAANPDRFKVIFMGHEKGRKVNLK